MLACTSGKIVGKNGSKKTKWTDQNKESKNLNANETYYLHKSKWKRHPITF